MDKSGAGDPLRRAVLDGLREAIDAAPSKAEAARTLGVSRTSLYKYYNRLQLPGPLVLYRAVHEMKAILPAGWLEVFEEAKGKVSTEQADRLAVALDRPVLVKEILFLVDDRGGASPVVKVTLRGK